MGRECWSHWVSVNNIYCACLKCYISVVMLDRSWNLQISIYVLYLPCVRHCITSWSFRESKDPAPIIVYSNGVNKQTNRLFYHNLVICTPILQMSFLKSRCFHDVFSCICFLNSYNLIMMCLSIFFLEFILFGQLLEFLESVNFVNLYISPNLVSFQSLFLQTVFLFPPLHLEQQLPIY